MKMVDLGSHLKSMLPLLLARIALCFVSVSAELPRFKQANTNGGSLNFLVIGDWGRRGTYNQSHVAKQMGVIGEELDVDFVISTDDNFYDDGLTGENDTAFRESFTNIYTAKSLQKPWCSVLGNHDCRGNVEAQLSPHLKELDGRWHCQRSFILDTKPVDSFFIDTNPFVNKYFDDPENHTYDWKGVMPRDKYISDLLRDLNLTLSKSRAKWKIVVGHHALRSIGQHGDTNEIVQLLLPILEANKVDMYMNGHDHCLQHIKTPKSKIQYLTSGGGSKAWKNDIHYDVHQDSHRFYHDGQGFMSVKLTYHKADIVFYDIFGNPLHKFKLSKYRSTHKYR